MLNTPIRTPHVEVPEISAVLRFPNPTNVFVKDESQQLGRSIKGRVAYAMAKVSHDTGVQMVESSSGNLALGLGYWCDALGARPPLCLVDRCCDEPMLQALSDAGCIVEMMSLTSKEQDEQSGVLKRMAKARRYAAQGYYWPNQYDSYDWIRVHQQTTGREIWEDGREWDIVVSAVGTGATISGIALAKPAGCRCKLVAVEPNGSSIFGSMPAPYRVAGAGNPFTPGNYRQDLVDLEVTIDDDAVFSAARMLRAAGVKIGSSGSMALLGAHRARQLLGRKVRNALVVVADDGWYEGMSPRQGLAQ